MAYALVGSIGAVASGATAGSNTAVTPSFAQATTAGNLLIGWLFTANGGTTPTATAGWTLAAKSGTNFNANIFYKANCSAGESAPTFTVTGVTGIAQFACVAEFSGGATTSPLDQTGSAEGSSSPQVGICAAVDSASGQLLIACGYSNATKAATTTTSHTFNNGATPTGNVNQDGASDVNHYRFAYGITTSKSAADQSSFADSSMNLFRLAVAVASFKLAGGANTYTKSGYGKEAG